jgi:two-component system cell cycle sensor histidine kinase/response regulator CckA
MTHGSSILIVDDDRESLALLTGTLEAEGYVVHPAESGPLALALAATKPPDLILLDIRMPGMGGFEVCRRLKDREDTRCIPVIFITSGREVEERVEGLRLGAVEFINRFFRPEELLARVRTHIELGRLRADLEKQVAQRTVELRKANERLQEELWQRQLTEQALRESEERFRSLADTAPVAIWVTGPDRLGSFFNKRALTFAGRTLQELVGNRWTELVHPDDRDHVCAEYRAAVVARRPFRMECRMKRADGQYRWVLNTGIPRFVECAYIGHIGTVVDTTDLKLSQKQMLATQKMESLGALAAGIAHDFNNMLGVMFAESDVALLETTLHPPLRQNIERIKAVAVRASEIVKLLIAYAGGTEMAMENVDLSLIVKEMVELLRDSIPERALLRTSLANDLLVRANAAQIRQVVLNLIKNAEEALEGGEGLIAVAAERIYIGRPPAPEGPTGTPEGEYVRLMVSDTGCGMTQEVQAKALDPFYTTKFLGRGLGLAVVQGILRSHGGHIQIMSKHGTGSTFQILLPCARLASEQTKASAERVTSSPFTSLLAQTYTR